MFHHRTPTSTDNVINSCHPFTIPTKDGKIILIHNGVIYNDDELFGEHKKLGIKYGSYDKKTKKFNDSESLAVDFARYISGEQKKLKARGWIALIAFHVDKDDNLKKMYFARDKGAELNFTFTSKGILVGSEVVGKLVEQDKLYEFDYKTTEITKTPIEFGAYSFGNTTIVEGEHNGTSRTYSDYYDYYDSYNRDEYLNQAVVRALAEKKDEEDNKYFEAKYKRNNRTGIYEPNEFEVDIINMPDLKLADYIKKLEDSIQAVEEAMTPENEGSEIGLMTLYDLLDEAYFEQDDRKKQKQLALAM
jgi:hypothetical protein